MDSSGRSYMFITSGRGLRGTYSRVVFIQRFRVVLELVILSFIILLK